MFYHEGSLGYLSNNSGTLGCSTSFSPSCVWIASGELNATLAKDGKTLQSFSDNNKYLIGTQGSRNKTVTIGTSSSNVWHINGDERCLSTTYSSGYYTIYKSGSSFITDRADYSTTVADKIANNRFVAIKVELGDYINTMAITGPVELDSRGTFTYSHNNASYVPLYFKFTLKGTEYIYDGESNPITEIPASTTDGITYEWGLDGIDPAYATVNSSTGEVTYHKMIDVSSQTAILKCTATHTASGTKGTNTYDITFKNNDKVAKPIIVCTKETDGTIQATIATETTDAKIYYTIDGSDPTESSTRKEYEGPFTVEDNVTIKAFATKTEYVPSDVDETDSHVEYTFMCMYSAFNTVYILTYKGSTLSNQQGGKLDSANGDIVFFKEHGANGDYFKTKDGKYLGPISIASESKLQLYDDKTGKEWTINGNRLVKSGNIILRGRSTWDIFDISSTSTSYGNVVYKYYETTEVPLNFTNEISGPSSVSTIGTYTAPIECKYESQMFVQNNDGVTTYLHSQTHNEWWSGNNSKENEVKYTWSISSTDVEHIEEYARVDANGTVTYFKYVPDKESVKVTLTCTVSIEGQEKSETKEIYLIKPTDVVQPIISISEPTGVTTEVTIIHPAQENATIYYTTDGSTPTTTSGTEYTGPFNVAGVVVIKAIAVVGDKESDIAVKVTHSVSEVVLYDLEDHNWIYYKGLDTDVDAEYNTNYEGKIYNPEPRNVKIVYNGGGIDGASDVAVSGTEKENRFVYYETLEKYIPSQWLKGDYPYQVIPNPFSKRPKKDDTYYGFNGWKIVSGAEYIQRADEKDTPVNGVTVLDLEEVINFKSLLYPEVNCISAEIEFEATWAEAEVIESPTMPTFTKGYNSYERNFWIMTATDVTNYTYTGEMTVTAQSPDGGATIPENTGIYLGGTITISEGTTKFEWIPIKNGNAINANGKNLYLGRGITMGTAYRTISGCSTNNGTVNQSLRVESGVYDNLYFYAYGSSSTNINISKVDKLVAYIGCDYDRAKNDNEKLKINGATYLSNYTSISLGDEVDETCLAYVKSGTFNSNKTDAGTASAGSSLYYGFSNKQSQKGHRYLEIQGGEFWSIAGGIGGTGNGHKENLTLVFRIKGGNIKGSIYGAGEYSGAGGSRSFVITGGNVKGWIAGGANGTQDTGGKTDGETYIYIGGNTRVDSEGSTSPINSALGGNVFGAGCGYSAETKAGEVTLGTNVVIADNAYIERGVYGGGAFGFTGKTSNLYMLGGVVDGKGGGVDVSPTGSGNSSNNHPLYTNIDQGGFYGGASKNDGGTVNIKMYGGEIHTGLYGGSNVQGTIANSVSLQIDGGQVGLNGAPANIHGGGYGLDTEVSGDVSINIGAIDADNKTSGTATVYGDVYGGSALGTVNTDTDNHTTIKVYDGDFYGNVYGGGLGQKETSEDANDGIEAVVNGEVEVDVYGGKFHSTKTTETRSDDSKEVSYYTTGQVFGCNNQAGTPKGKVTVNVFKTGDKVDGNAYAIGAVYGGGNEADYVPTYTPETGEVRQTTVNVVDCSSSIDYVYGGGNAADVPNTEVNVYGANTIGSVFGGGNGVRGAAYAANIVGTGDSQKGTTHVNIYGGTIGEVYGGSNSNGDVTGSANVFLDEQPYDGNDLCPYSIGGAYSAGNEAVMYGTSNLTIGCLSSKLDAIYGGAKNADVNNDIDLRITSGSFGKVFGGNNLGGSINGSIKVTIDETGCKPVIIDELYGGGNHAAYTTPEGKPEPTVNVISFTHIGEVFGGGYGAAAVVTGNPVVNINVIPGKHANEDEVKTYLDAHKLGSIGTVFGGGNAANVIGDTYVNIGTVTTNKHVSGNDTTTDHKVGAYVTGNVYGGGNRADVTGNARVVVGKPKTTSVTP